jgi:hypothetical protein
MGLNILWTVFDVGERRQVGAPSMKPALYFGSPELKAQINHLSEMVIHVSRTL